VTEPAPLLRIVRGDATPEELAALVAVLTARGQGDAEPAPAPRSAWGRPQLRQPLTPGPGAWLLSALSR
jgi:hypothetical protein